MKRLFASALSLIALTATGHASAEPVRVESTFNKVYVPDGFDSNDAVQIVGEGLFRNTCYRPAKTDISIDHEKQIVHVGPAAYEYSGFCLQVILPYNRVVDIGMLKAGDWTIVQGAQGEKIGEIKVRKAFTSSPDDYLYAPVTQAFYKQRGAVSEIMITGEFTNDCITLDHVKTSVANDVIVLQPIAKVRNGNCREGAFGFSKLVKLDLLPKGKHLLHVRSMNGNAINTLINVAY